MASSLLASVPGLPVRIEVAPSISGFENLVEETCYATLGLTESRLNAVLAALGIPGKALVEIAGSAGSPRRGELVRLWVNGERCRYSHALAERVYCYVRGLRWAPVPTSDIESWLQSAGVNPAPASPPLPHSSFEQLPEFIATLCEEAVKQSPRLLLGPAQVEAYRRILSQQDFCAEGKQNSVGDQLKVILGAIVQQGISIAHSQPIGESIASGSLSATDVAEELIVSLRRRTVEIRLSPEYLRELTLSDTEDDKASFQMLRDALFYELGLRLPDFHFETVEGMPPRSFAFKVNDLSGLPWIGLSSQECAVNLAPGELTQRLGEGVQAIMNPGNLTEIGVIAVDRKSKFREDEGLSFWSALGYLVLGFSHELRKHAPQFIHVQVVSDELDRLASAFPDLVQTARRRLTVQQITGVLRLLLAEEISVRSLVQILSSLIDFDYLVTDTRRLIVFDDRLPIPRQPEPGWREAPGTLASGVRMALKRYISHKYTRGQSTLPVYLLTPEIEEALAPGGECLDETREEETLAAVQAEDTGSLSIARPVILTAADVRPAVRALLEKVFPHLAVVAYQELSPDMNIQAVSRISLD